MHPIIDKVYNYFCSRNPHLHVYMSGNTVSYGVSKKVNYGMGYDEELRNGYLMAVIYIEEQIIRLYRCKPNYDCLPCEKFILNQFHFSAVDQLGLIL